MHEPSAVRVSVVTLTFNHSRYIAECIKSVQAQTSPVSEHLVWDNGSDDGTGDVAAEMLQGADRLIRSEALPVGEAYRRLFAEAKGEWICILDGDDRWHPNRVRVLLDAVADAPDWAALHFAGASLISSDGTRLGKYNAASYGFLQLSLRKNLRTPFKGLVRLEFMPPTAATAVRRSALSSIGGVRMTECLPLIDLPTWLCLASRGYGFLYSHVEVADYRRHDQSITVRNGRDVLRGQVNYITRFLDGRTDLSALRRWHLRSRNRGLVAYVDGLDALDRGDRLRSARHFARAACMSSRRTTSARAFIRLCLLPWSR